MTETNRKVRPDCDDDNEAILARRDRFIRRVKLGGAGMATFVLTASACPCLGAEIEPCEAVDVSDGGDGGNASDGGDGGSPRACSAVTTDAGTASDSGNSGRDGSAKD